MVLGARAPPPVRSRPRRIALCSAHTAQREVLAASRLAPAAWAPRFMRAPCGVLLRRNRQRSQKLCRATMHNAVSTHSHDTSHVQDTF